MIDVYYKEYETPLFLLIDNLIEFELGFSRSYATITLIFERSSRTYKADTWIDCLGLIQKDYE